MRGHECYHCKQWVEEGEAHDCWTTTEAALTRDLSEDLRDAWDRLRETAVTFGDQRIYASHKSIMFSRKSCYFFVRPKKGALEVCVFLGRVVKAPQIRRADEASKTKTVHFIDVRHRDEVEPPITDWLREAYEMSGAPAPKVAAKPAKTARSRGSGGNRSAARRLCPLHSPLYACCSVFRSSLSIWSMAFMTRDAFAASLSLSIPPSEFGMICHDSPNLSFNHPHRLGAPPSARSFDHRSSISCWVSHPTKNEVA